MEKRAALFLANGFEEVEALAVADILRRAGVVTELIGVNGEQISGSHGICVTTDLLIDNLTWNSYDILILPGGMPGTLNLFECEKLKQGVGDFYHAGKDIAAICAAPLVLGRLGLLEGHMACVYPGYEEELIGAQIVESPAIKDGNIITGRGMGCSYQFAFLIVETLLGQEVALKIKKSILWE